MIETRYYQAEAIEAIFNYLMSKEIGNPVVAMPTGTGKSIVIGDLVTTVLTRWPERRFLMATHVKELIKQNAAKLKELWPSAPLGIYSAGLGRKEYNAPVVFGGVASLVNHAEDIGHRDIMIVDEAHLVSPKAGTMYGRLIAQLKEINPWLRVIGLTATPYRMGQGLITEGGIFDDICFDITGKDAFNKLIAEGYLCLLIPKQTNTKIDLSNVTIQQGEYKQNELQNAVDREKITFEALSELMAHSQDRVCGMIFATGIQHAEHINDMLMRAFNQTSVCIHSDNEKSDNDAAMRAWKNGAVKWAVSMNSLTTGVDNPRVDVIGMLRPTLSPALWVQMLGRGTRPCPETNKQNCLVLDFAANTRRLGPVNDPHIPRKKGKATGEAPIRICDECGTYNHASARVCICCGCEFEIKTKFKKTAESVELVADGFAKIELHEVSHVIYNRHQKDNGPASIRVSYFCGPKKFDEWICFDHEGYPRKKATEWILQRGGIMPKTTAEALTTDEVLQNKAFLRAPKRIKVWVNKQYPEITGYEY